MLRRLRHITSGALRAARNEPAVRRIITRSEKPDTNPKDWFSGIDDETWFWMNTTGRRRRKAIARLVPKMPEVSTQETYTGWSGDSTLREGFDAYRVFKKCYETHIGPIGFCPAVLDFGCGWGRIIRFFLKDVEPQKLSGVDHSEEAIRACQETNKWCKFTLIEPMSSNAAGARVFRSDLSVFSLFTPAGGNALDAAEGISSASRAWRHVDRHNSTT